MVGEDSPAELAECRAQLRVMALVLSHAQDDERTRIARGLHDELGQALTALALGLADLDHLDHPDDLGHPDDLRDSGDLGHPDDLGHPGDLRGGSAERKRIERHRMIVGLGELVDQAVESVRTLTFELSSPIMPEIGIEDELGQLARSVTRSFGMPCTFVSDSEPKPVSPEVAMTLMRACRELLHNVVKHAQATHSTVRVGRAGPQIRLTVSDDGVGYDPGTLQEPQRHGFGLIIVRERIGEVGGSFELHSTPGEGTRAIVNAPLLCEEGTG